MKLSTLVICGGAAVGLGLLAFMLFRSSPGPAVANSGESARTVSSRRARSLPRFNNAGHPSGESSAQPSTHQAPPPTFIKPEHAELRERATKDGFLYREDGSDAVWVVQGGTRYLIKSPQEFESLGYKWDQIEQVPRGSLGFLSDRPAERALLRERDSAAVFIFENGQKRFITSPKVFERLGFSYGDIKVIPAGGLSRETPGGALY